MDETDTHQARFDSDGEKSKTNFRLTKYQYTRVLRATGK